MTFDVLDLLAVIVGVLHTVRKLDVMKRRAKDYPSVSADDFMAWQESERAAYALGSWASMLKIVLDPALILVAGQISLTGPVLRGLGAAIDISWAIAVIVAIRRAGRARRRREALGIVLSDAPTNSAG